MSSTLIIKYRLLVLIALCPCLSFACVATAHHINESSAAVVECSVSAKVLRGTSISPALQVSGSHRFVVSEPWADDVLEVSSSRSLSGNCAAEVNAYDGANLSFASGVLVRVTNDGLQEVPQTEQRGIHDRLHQRTHNSPGAPAELDRRPLTGGVQLGAAHCPSPTGVYLASWQGDGAAILGIYSRDSTTGNVSKIKKLGLVDAPLRSVGFLPGVDTDDGQLFLSIKDGKKMHLVNVRLNRIEQLAKCP